MAHLRSSISEIRAVIISAWLALAVTVSCSAQANDSLFTGNCPQPTAEAYLDVGNVRALLPLGGTLVQKGRKNVYEVPKGSGVNSLFNFNLWVGGLVDGELRTAGSSNSPEEYWPGPLDDSGSPPVDCSVYDQIWSLSSEDWDSRVTSPESRAEILGNWPTDLGAPYAELNNIEGFQPTAGDKFLMHGDQMHWWVMNDRGNIHSQNGTTPLGIEVRVVAYAYAFNIHSFIANSTFFEYTIINKSANAIKDVYIGIQSDVDIGDGKNDAMGTETSLGMVYGYNGSNDDGNGAGEYGDQPPALGMLALPSDHLPGRILDKFSHTMVYYNGGGILGDPRGAEDRYNYLQSRWKDGSHLTAGHRGLTGSSIETNFAFYGDPTTSEYWSFSNADSLGNGIGALDVRMIGSFGPLDLAPSDTVSFSLALVWSRGTDYLDSVTKLFSEARRIRDNWQVFTSPTTVDPLIPPPTPFEFAASIYPNPATEEVVIRYSIPMPMNVQIDIVDVLGRRLHTVQHGMLPEGEVESRLSVREWAPGVYYVRMRFDHISDTRSLVVY